MSTARAGATPRKAVADLGVQQVHASENAHRSSRAGRRDLAVGVGQYVDIGDEAGPDVVPQVRGAERAGQGLAVLLAADRHACPIGEGAAQCARMSRGRRAVLVEHLLGLGPVVVGLRLGSGAVEPRGRALQRDRGGLRAPSNPSASSGDDCKLQSAPRVPTCARVFARVGRRQRRRRSGENRLFLTCVADTCTPLLTAVNNRNYALASMLIERGADVNLANKGGWTPL